MNQKILFRGAEANIIQNGDRILKERIPKSYRIKELDEKIRKQRTKSEAKLLEKASKIINSPMPIYDSKDKFKITIPLIKGKKLSESLEKFQTRKQLEIFKQIGKDIAKLHDSEIIHGDLTTSNMILSERGKVYIIDFGLGFISSKVEDKAVDIHLLKQALESKHFKNSKELLNYFFKGYKTSKLFRETLERFKKVEARGRYKENY